MRTALRLTAGAIGAVALAVQYWGFALSPSSPGIVAGTIHFLSYFTILTNCLAACAMLAPLVAENSAPARFCSEPAVRLTIAGYMIIVGVVFFLLLRDAPNPTAWGIVADQVLHYVTPALFLIDWLAFVPKGKVGWRVVDRSLLFPLAFLLWTVAHGVATNWYPYPFVDAVSLGYGSVFRNFVAFSIGFMAVAAILLVIDRLMAHGQRTRKDVAPRG